MARQAGVIEDGVTSEPVRPRSNPGWVLAVTGFVVGLGLGVLVVNPGLDEASPPVTAPSDGGVGAPTTAAPLPEGAGGIEGSVPEFPDTLVAIARTSGSALDHLLWPRQGALRIRSMTGGGDVVMDRGARFIALSEPIPGRDGVVLSMGRYNQIGNVANGVTSYVWHDSESGVLGYTTESDGRWRLFQVKPSLRSRLVIESSELGGTLIGFGNWGWAIQSSPAEITLLTPDGAFKDVEAGVGYASHPSGWVFAMDEGPKLVSAGGGVVRIDADPGVGAISTAVFSPDGAKVAMAGERGWTVLDVTDGSAKTFGLSPASLAWSSDSRFVLAATGSGVVVYDIDSEAEFPVLRGESVVVAGAAPLNSSDS